MATSAPLSRKACDITSPNLKDIIKNQPFRSPSKQNNFNYITDPLAPPVTTQVFPSKLKVASVFLKCFPPRPCILTGFDLAKSSSSGYSTSIEGSIRLLDGENEARVVLNER